MKFRRKVKRTKKGKKTIDYNKGSLFRYNNPKSQISLRNPYPQRFRTVLTCNWSGNLNAGALNFTGYAFFYINGNACQNPFVNFPGTLSISSNGGSITNANQTPAGFGNLFGTLGGSAPYGRVRCIASKLKMHASPLTGGDIFNMVINPYIIGTTGFGSIISAGQAPMSRGPLLCTGNNNQSMNTLTAYLSTAQVFGLDRKHVYEDDTYTFTSGVLPVNEWRWRVQFNTIDNTTNTGQFAINIQMRYYVEFSELEMGALQDT